MRDLCWQALARIRRVFRRRVDPIHGLIKTPRQTFTGSDEALQARTAAKRKAADAIRLRAAKVESGAPVADVLKIARRG